MENNTLNSRLQLIQSKVSELDTIRIMIIGLGSVGGYLLDYLVSMADPKMEIIVVGRDKNRLEQSVNIYKTAATIRGQFRSTIIIEPDCDLDTVDRISDVLLKYKPDIIVNSSRAFAGVKYGSISWHTLRAYGIWTPLSIRYARNIMLAYDLSKCNAIVINTSYSDAVNPWLKSAGLHHPDFGSGNLNHLIPRIKFIVSQKYSINNLNDIDISLAVSHFHDVVISKEGHSEGLNLLLKIKNKQEVLNIDQVEIFKHCAINMPTDQKRNMMNASSNFNIIDAIYKVIRKKQKIKIHSPGVDGEIGGYPYIIYPSGNTIDSRIDESDFSIAEMREANKQSLLLDGIESIENATLSYTDLLLEKVKTHFNVSLPKHVSFDEIDSVGDFLIKNIIEKVR